MAVITQRLITVKNEANQKCVYVPSVCYGKNDTTRQKKRQQAGSGAPEKSVPKRCKVDRPRNKLSSVLAQRGCNGAALLHEHGRQ